ncbi:hypothetical protein PTMSG1_05708 [Pyrenophora teres f. maculata]|nr:hypothetical protein PTMSG1_05708 [Pyrenophora teres f. maculata]
MKVVEQNSDRQVSAHVYVEGKIAELKEYGQYVDPNNGKAIGCYIPIDEGDQLRIRTWFSGTTLAITHDILIDGTIRKTHHYMAKTVSQQKQKKLEFGRFLYATEKGVLDTVITAAQLQCIKSTQSDAPETIGTIELQLHVVRQLDVFHTMEGLCNYDDDTKNKDKAAANYKLIAPSLQMNPEKNCRLLEPQETQREQRRLHSRRPGTEPWAIFRFHYRTRKEIEQHKLNLTFDPADKADIKAHTLVFDTPPPLMLGAKPQKTDLVIPSQTTSPMIPATPHPVQSAQTKPKVPPKRPTSLTNEVNPNSKRTKMAIEAHLLAPKPVSMERRLSELQKKLDNLRELRISQAKEQSKIDEQMAAYKELMAAELERLNKDFLEEEGVYAEEVEHYKASAEVLQKFKQADGDI